MSGIAQVISYVAALGLAAAITGPGMTALVARSVCGGAVSAFAMLAGLILGDLIYLTLAIFGLGVIGQTNDTIFTLINYAASLYLCLLSWQFWCSQPEAINIAQKTTNKELATAWFSGLTITLGNPKTIAFYLAILPLVISLDNVSLKMWGGMLVPVTVLVLLSVGAVFILAALRIRHLLASEKAQRRLFRLAASIMILAASGMVIKNL